VLRRWIEFVSGPLKFALGFATNDELELKNLNKYVVREILEAVLKHKNRGPDEARASAKVLDCKTLKALVSGFPKYALPFFRKLELTAVDANHDMQNTQRFILPM
jgi:hypothetical protein